MTDELSKKAIPVEDKATRARLLTSQCFDEKKYEYDFKFKQASPENFLETHTTVEMLRCLEHDPEIELSSKVLTQTAKGLKYTQLNSSQFREAFIKNDQDGFKFKEDSFASSPGDGGHSGLVGNDFTPLLGGPFYKNLYYYDDYLRMHSECFFAYHNDPIAKAVISITRDFVLGTGFEIQCDTSDRRGQMAMAVWKAFEEANDFQQQIDDVCVELAIYGETMLWWLPGNQTKIVYNLNADNPAPVGMIPRVRLIDVSNIVEIVTYPEDITRKLFYVWLTPTQYQIYTAGSGALASDVRQPSLKFIYQQIPADQIMHYRVNAVSNEKRGRSDLFPVLSYLKRLRDSVNYSLIADQKVSAWAIDTTVDGSQSDIDAYCTAQARLGTIPEAGSEFVHSKAITRQYLGNSSASGKMSDTSLWCISMICAGTQIPFNYLGTHLSSGSTRASAVISTEPVAKKMEKRRDVLKRIIKQTWDRLMKDVGLQGIGCNIIFPELITQDRSQKLQDLLLGQQAKWWSEERAATVAAKELGIQDYDYNTEQDNINKSSLPGPSAPLTQPGAVPAAGLPPLPGMGQATQQPGTPSAVTSTDKAGIKQNGTQ